ncbi:YheC/YheD family protein [Brevibacillus ginsengisoli]|uniref:YheC/YheD family endospore coat-associated protein n=1 Tax=Brevibacillus ginsengisoli TaxID=363854 RepID=UPI003CF09EB7
MNKPIIGILTRREGKRFMEPQYFRRLIRAGNELGAIVFLFSPADVRIQEGKVRGYVPSSQGGWLERWFRRPDVVIDRFRYTPNQSFREYVQFRNNSSMVFANNRLANKWRVHQVLWKDEQMRQWLPETCHYQPTAFRNMLAKHKYVFVKPSNGTGGRGILRIKKTANGYELLGRTKQRNIIQVKLTTPQALSYRVKSWAQGELFVVQQGLALDLIPGRTVDIRLLIQKNSEGQWDITGMGVRVGGSKSATSNLHGGGKAVPAVEFLTPRFGSEQTLSIIGECHELAHRAAGALENHFGRLIELGLDIGIDVNGRAWLIEVNPKPGREIFRELGQKTIYRQAIRRPIEYAMYLSRISRERKS